MDRSHDEDDWCPFERTVLRLGGGGRKSACQVMGREIWTNCRETGECRFPKAKEGGDEDDLVPEGGWESDDGGGYGEGDDEAGPDEVLQLSFDL